VLERLTKAFTTVVLVACGLALVVTGDAPRLRQLSSGGRLLALLGVGALSMGVYVLAESAAEGTWKGRIAAALALAAFCLLVWLTTS
jgi:hypothetical protein